MASAPLSQTRLRLVDANANEPAIDIAVLNACTVQAMLTAIDVLDLALGRLRSAWGAMPDSDTRKELIQEGKRLAFTLYAVRMATLRL